MMKWIALTIGLFFSLATCAHAACGPDSPPAAAAAQGLTCEIFVDSMTNIGKFDVSDTRVQGFNWYVHQAWPNAAQTATWTTATSPTPSSDYTVGVGGTILSPALDNYPISMLSTCAYSGSSYVGTAFQAPFYIDVTFTYTGSAQGPQWPAVWMAPTEFMTAGNGASVTWDELDLFESPFPSWVHEWVCTTGTCTDSANSYSVTQVGSVTGAMVLTSSLTREHNDTTADVLTYGASVAPTKTTGTFWSGGNPTSSPSVGAFKYLGTGHYCLMLTAGPGQPLTVTKVAVWAAPSQTGPARFPFMRGDNDNFKSALKRLAQQ